jgi:hypothetical protein
MIYSRPGFLAVVLFGSSPTPLPHSPVSKLSPLSQSSCVAGRAYLGEREAGWGRSQIVHLVLYNINHSILSGATRPACTKVFSPRFLIIGFSVAYKCRLCYQQTIQKQMFLLTKDKNTRRRCVCG